MPDPTPLEKTAAAAANPATVPSFKGTLAPGVHVVGGMGNALSVETDAGVVQLDTGVSDKQATRMLERLRELTDAPLHAIVYSHGHLGYNNAVETWLRSAEQRGDPAPPGHRARESRATLAALRRDRGAAALLRRASVSRAAGHGRAAAPDTHARRDLPRGVDLRQCGPPHSAALGALRDRRRHRAVDAQGAAALRRRGRHAQHPERRHPPAEPAGSVRWAETLDRLAALDPEIVVMEFGPPIEGRERIQQVLRSTSAALHWLRREVVARINRGMGVVEIVHDLDYPARALRAALDEAPLRLSRIHRARRLSRRDGMVGSQPDESASRPSRRGGGGGAVCHRRSRRGSDARSRAGRSRRDPARVARRRRAGAGARGRGRGGRGPRPQGRAVQRPRARGDQLRLPEPLRLDGEDHRQGTKVPTGVR